MGRRVMKKLILLTAGLVLLFTGCDDLTKELEEAILASNGLQENTLTIKAGSGGSVSPETVIKVRNDVPVTLTATPETDINFQNWEKTDGDGTVAFSAYRDETTTVTLNDGDATVTGFFTANPTGSISIQNKVFLSGKNYSSTREVSIHFTYSSNAQDMKVSESNFSKGTANDWESSSLSSTYTFSSDGSKTLYVRFRDSLGNESEIYEDTIYIDSTAPRFTKYEVDRVTYPYSDGTLYVTSASSTDLSLDYLATDDAGVGVEKVYFANYPFARPSTAQIDPYPNPPTLYPWSLRYTTTRGYYYVRFWVEDLLGNISNAYEREVRFDDKYERSGGNNTIDSLSGATKVVSSSSDYNDDLYSGYGEYAYLVDTDYYKWGFYGYQSANGNFMNPFSTFYADFVIYINEAGDWEDDFDIDFFDHNWDPIATTAPVYNESARTLTFDQQVIMPYVNTNGYEYYFYMRIRRNGVSAPYSPRNYNISWDFWEDEGM